MSNDSENWSIYLVETASGVLYTGISNDVAKRFAAHCEGTGAKFLRGKGPLKLVYCATVGSRQTASRLEPRIKALKRSEKQNLIRGTRLLPSLAKDQ